MNPPQFTPDDAWLKANFPDLAGLTVIGQGGQKLVFSAQHPTEGEVVLKVFHPHQGIDEVEREILAVTQVQSDHVPKIFAQGTVNASTGVCYWVREQRVRGETLRARVQRGALPPLEVLRLGKEILGSLVLAERAAIVHRDVKPDNIIVDAQGKYWLLDFGLARHLSLTSLTATALPWGKGTPGYAPPEQVRNDKPAIDARADLFGLGITLYEAATGSNPFHIGARDVRQVLQRCELNPLPVLNLHIHKAESFRDLVAAMTQKRRDHRPRDAAEASVWIEEICVANGI